MLIHIFKDGTQSTSVDGVVIKSKEFYQVLKDIGRKK